MSEVALHSDARMQASLATHMKGVEQEAAADESLIRFTVTLSLGPENAPPMTTDSAGAPLLLQR